MGSISNPGSSGQGVSVVSIEGDHTLQDSDENKILDVADPGEVPAEEPEEEGEMEAGQAVITIPPHADTPFPVGAEIRILCQDGDGEGELGGEVIVEAGAGVTLYWASNVELNQGAVPGLITSSIVAWLILRNIAEDVWLVEGHQGFGEM